MCHQCDVHAVAQTYTLTCIVFAFVMRLQLADNQTCLEYHSNSESLLRLDIGVFWQSNAGRHAQWQRAQVHFS